MNIFVEKVCSPFFSMSPEELLLVEEKLKEAKKVVRKRFQENKREENARILKELKDEAKAYRLAKAQEAKEKKQAIALQLKEDEKVLNELCDEVFRGNVKVGDYISFQIHGKIFTSTVKRVHQNTVQVFVPTIGERYIPFSKIRPAEAL